VESADWWGPGLAEAEQAPEEEEPAAGALAPEENLLEQVQGPEKKLVLETPEKAHRQAAPWCSWGVYSIAGQAQWQERLRQAQQEQAQSRERPQQVQWEEQAQSPERQRQAQSQGLVTDCQPEQELWLEKWQVQWQASQGKPRRGRRCKLYRSCNSCR